MIGYIRCDIESTCEFFVIIKDFSLFCASLDSACEIHNILRQISIRRICLEKMQIIYELKQIFIIDGSIGCISGSSYLIKSPEFLERKHISKTY